MAKSAGPLLIAPELKGRAYAEAHTAATDEWFRRVYQEALGEITGLALVAVGGYGRRVLCPYSDIDVILIHDNVDNYADAAEALWYPVWDRGIKMGYAVVNLEQAAVLAREELHWATALFSSRLVEGDATLLARLDEATSAAWTDPGADLMGLLAESVHARHEEHGDVAFQIEPHLKEGRGGLRDLHALTWASHAVPGFDDGRRDQLQADADLLLDARVELHRLAGRPGDVLNLEVQDDVATALGDATTHDLMVRLALAGRRIAWHSDEAWSHWERRTGRASLSGVLAQPMSTEFGLVDGYIEVTDKVDVANDPLVILRLAANAANADRTIGRASLELLRDKGAPMPEPWPAEARRLFAQIFLAGRPAITVVEDLDHFDLMTRLIPEWEAVRCHPQRNVLHTYTIDRHLCEAAANASAAEDTLFDACQSEQAALEKLLAGATTDSARQQLKAGIAAITAAKLEVSGIRQQVTDALAGIHKQLESLETMEPPVDQVMRNANKLRDEADDGFFAVQFVVSSRAGHIAEEQKKNRETQDQQSDARP